MELTKILKGVRVKGRVKKIVIQKICYNSKECVMGSLFVAVKGTECDGHDFALNAYQRGARAFIAQRKLNLPDDAHEIIVSDSRRALSAAAANFYGNPSLEMKVYGVVGTNGKTTTTYILEAILREAAMNPGVIGTVNYRYADKVIRANNTTPESLDMQRMMRMMRSEDVKSVITEVSSHALHQGRVNGIYFDAGIFTNLTQDHLDYHKSMRNYFLAKRRFFNLSLMRSRMEKSVWAAINIDDKHGARLFDEFKESYKVIPFGMRRCEGVYLKDAAVTVDGAALTVHTPKGEMKIDTHLTGEFNIYNILGAIALCVGEGIPAGIIESGIRNLKQIPGRMQKINTASGCIFVDYAHTPDALERVIMSVRRLGVKRIITVFGCGGNRDRGKRRMMGDISARLSDISIVTSDNPRDEDPGEIIDEILQAFKEAGNEKNAKRCLRHVDREDAIKEAVRLMQAGDAVIVAGKGHEDYQIIRGERLPFDDMRVVKKYLKKYRIKEVR